MSGFDGGLHGQLLNTLLTVRDTSCSTTSESRAAGIAPAGKLGMRACRSCCCTEVKPPIRFKMAGAAPERTASIKSALPVCVKESIRSSVAMYRSAFLEPRASRPLISRRRVRAN